jgi:hypothetical protein
MIVPMPTTCSSTATRGPTSHPPLPPPMAPHAHGFSAPASTPAMYASLFPSSPHAPNLWVHASYACIWYVFCMYACGLYLACAYVQQMDGKTNKDRHFTASLCMLSIRQSRRLHRIAAAPRGTNCSRASETWRTEDKGELIWFASC